MDWNATRVNDVGTVYGYIGHMKATLLIGEKVVLPDGAILEVVIWRLPQPDAERAHGLKYSLYYGKAGVRLVGYDNERGKGDHRHYRDHEEPYVFESVETLRADFLADVERERGESL